MMASLLRLEEGTPNIVFVGVPDRRALNRVKAKLSGYQITHYVWSEPDFDFGETAIATAPLSEEEKRPLSNYRVYSPGPAQAACVLTDDGRANAAAAPAEHQTFSLEVGGENPSCGPNFERRV